MGEDESDSGGQYGGTEDEDKSYTELENGDEEEEDEEKEENE